MSAAGCERGGIEWVTLVCPLCSTPPVAAVSPTQAVCANALCKLILWDPTKTIDELMNDIWVIDLRDQR